MGTSRCCTSATSTSTGAEADAPLVWLEQLVVVTNIATGTTSVKVKTPIRAFSMYSVGPLPARYPACASYRVAWCEAIRGEPRLRDGLLQPNPLAGGPAKYERAPRRPACRRRPGLVARRS